MSFGFHTGYGGNPTGIGSYVKDLDNAGTPATIVAADVTTGISDALSLIRNGSNVKHNLVYRVVRDGSERFAVPDYTLSPSSAARVYRDLVQPFIPPEIKEMRRHVYIALGNELARDRADWIGKWMVESALLWAADGYRVIGPNWAAGTPEPGHWLTPGMLSYLAYCQHGDDAAVGVHEYSLTTDSMRIDGYHIGRFMDIYDACDKEGYSYPDIIVTEFGWGRGDAPHPTDAIEDLNQVLDAYPYYPPAAIWWLGGGYNRICDDIQKLIWPVTMLTEERPRSDPPTNLDPVEVLWGNADSMEISLNPSAALETALRKAGATPTTDEFWSSIDEVTYAAQKGRDVNDPSVERLAFTIVPHWESVTVVKRGDIERGKLDGLQLGAPFRLPFVVTSRFNDTRSYGKHEGIDLDILNQPPDSKEPVLAIYSGEVTVSRFSNGAYGNYVVIKSEFNGTEFLIWYCHMDDRYVSVGDRVEVGSPIGELGGTGGFAEHVHINLQVPGYGLIGYVVDDVINPEEFISMEPAHEGRIDLLPYLKGDGHAYMVQSSSGASEKFRTETRAFRFYQVKNHQWEQLTFDDVYIYRGVDTSPGPAPDYDPRPGKYRYYIQSNQGSDVARWCHRYMRPGETYTGPGHRVQFYYKDNCEESPANSGNATNRVTFFERHQPWTSPNGITLDDVVELGSDPGERYFYGKGYGLVGWKSSDGSVESYISEDNVAGDNEMEIIPCL